MSSAMNHKRRSRRNHYTDNKVTQAFYRRGINKQRYVQERKSAVDRIMSIFRRNSK